MESTQKGILTLIKSAVLQEPLSIPEDFSLENAYPLIKSQHIAALAFEGAALCGISRQDPIMIKLFHHYCKALQASEGQLREIKKLEQLFQDNGIDYLLLKGCIMKGYYPKPELRTMGDADILIREEQYSKIVPLVEAMGFVFAEENYCHTVWKSDRLYLELHKKLIRKDFRVFHQYYGNGWHLAAPQSGTRYQMSPEDTFLFIFAHFTKHYMWSGIGCRQAVDLWVYLRSHPELNPEVLRQKLEMLGLCEFYGNIRDLIAYWFEDGPSSDKLEYITQYLFSGGSWGTEAAALQTEYIFKTGPEKQSKMERRLYFFKRIFPSLEILKYDYPILQRMPWLLPAVWVYRIMNKVLIERTVLKRINTLENVLDQKKIDQRREALRYVGLLDRF